MSDQEQTKEGTDKQGGSVERIVMCEYSQGLCADGAAILRDGEMMTIDEIIIELRSLAADANRYRFLKMADIDSIKNGGIFAGRTPENLILNGIDLDEAIDDELYT